MKPEFPLPTLHVKTYKSGKHAIKSIEGKMQLDAWKGFQSRHGPYNSIDRKDASDGWVKLTVDGDPEAEPLRFSAGQAAAYRYLMEHQEVIRANLLQALLTQYGEWWEQCGDLEEADSLPDATNVLWFQQRSGLSQVHLLDLSKAGMAYVGYEFGCEWDTEHGVGVMTHGDRVIDAGGADVSFNTWLAENDRDPVQAQKELEKYRDMRPVKVKKPWWKFW